MQRCEHWGLMEPPGMAFARKLSGASSSRVCTENLYQVTSQDISAATAGQLYSSSVHQQPGGGGGGGVSPTLKALAKSMWLQALERDTMITAQHIPGAHSRQLVQTGAGQI